MTTVLLHSSPAIGTTSSKIQTLSCVCWSARAILNHVFVAHSKTLNAGCSLNLCEGGSALGCNRNCRNSCWLSSVTFVLRQRSNEILYSYAKRQVTHVSSKLQCKMNVLDYTVNLAEQLLLTCTVHSSSINMRSIILLHIIKHEIIDFIDANIRYGFNGLLISHPRWNEC